MRPGGGEKVDRPLAGRGDRYIETSFSFWNFQERANRVLCNGRISHVQKGGEDGW